MDDNSNIENFDSNMHQNENIDPNNKGSHNVYYNLIYHTNYNLFIFKDYHTIHKESVHIRQCIKYQENQNNQVEVQSKYQDLSSVLVKFEKNLEQERIDYENEFRAKLRKIKYQNLSNYIYNNVYKNQKMNILLNTPYIK